MERVPDVLLTDLHPRAELDRIESESIYAELLLRLKD